MPSDLSPFVGTGFEAPAASAVSVTPSDSTNLALITRGLYVGGAGNLAVVMADGTAATFTGVLSGSILPIRVQRVNNTSTTATAILALY